MERRSSDNDEPARRPDSPDVFDDDREVDPDEEDFMPSVSDGFRPAAAGEGWSHDRHNHDRQDAPQRHTSTSKDNDADLRRMATRNSTAKTQYPTPLNSRPPALHNRGPSSPSPLGHRASVSSTGSFATTSNGDNPFETGPSHPYGMYPQHTVARTSSVGTASLDRHSQRPTSLQRPTHPYAMYSQSGLDQEPEEEPLHPPVPPIQTAIPVGFPGLNAGYHRVLGPDGEEQDIIGPDGHTEQLPPYSRYPEEGPTKASLAAEASASRIIPAPSTLLDTEDPFTTPVSPASPLSDTSFSAPALPSVPLLPSVTPARLPPQRPETQTGTIAQSTSATVTASQVPAEPSDSSSASLLTNEHVMSEKEELVDQKPNWYKRRLWGKVPMGLFIVSLLFILVAAIVLGVAIGIFINKKHSGHGKNKGPYNPNDQPIPQVTGPHGSLFDATPIPTPAGLGLLPTGAFALPLGIPQESNPGCLTQANQYSAWSCKLTFAPLVITINNTLSGGSRQVASMKAGNSLPDGTILYGLQTPDLSNQPLELVLDLDYKAYGPAYHFAMRYDKMVILRPEELVSGIGLKDGQQDDKNFRQRFQVKPGDLPWYCYWNQTYIEGYVYVEDNSTAAAVTTYAIPSGSGTASPDTASLPTALATQPPSITAGPTPTIPSGTPATPAPVSRRDAQSDANAPPRMASYPRIVKIEERRLPDSPQPYCQQMVLLDNGKIMPAPNGNDQPKTVRLQAQDPTYEEYFAAQATSTGNGRRGIPLQGRSDPSDACHCQWMFK